MYDCVVIGSGIAGMTAAIYLKRADLNIILLEKSIPGGQINRSAKVENYPGFKQIDGPTLASQIYEQIINLGVQYKYDDVKDIKKLDTGFEIITEKHNYLTKKVLVASGREANELNLPNEKELIGAGISYCAICDGAFFKNKDVAVVGGGNSALEETLYLSSICKKIYLIIRSNKFRADLSLVKRIEKLQNVEIIRNSNITKINKDNDFLSEIVLNNSKKLDVDGLFIYIGQTPNTNYLNSLEIQKNGKYLIVDKNMQTSIPGIYACGDVIDKKLYQLSTAVGEGAIAATSIINDL